MEREKKKKKENHAVIARIDMLKSPMPYPSPTVTLKLRCEQFWTFIVIVTFDLRYCACVRTNRQTRTIYIDITRGPAYWFKIDHQHMNEAYWLKIHHQMKVLDPILVLVFLLSSRA